MYMSLHHWAIPFSSRTCALPLLLSAFLLSITLVPIDTSALHLSLDLARRDAINPISAHSVAASRLGHIDHFTTWQSLPVSRSFLICIYAKTVAACAEADSFRPEFSGDVRPDFFFDIPY